MKCIRCEKEFDDYAPYRSTECYGGVAYYACPHCGKLYRFKRVVRITDAEDCADVKEEDDWGNKVVSDEKYNELINKK